MSPLMSKLTPISWLLLSVALWLAPIPPLHAESLSDLTAIDVARKLDQAFAHVAEQVTPSVVVIQVSHSKSHSATLKESHPFWDSLPPEFRDQMEDQWKEWQKKRSFRDSSPLNTSQGSGVIIRTNGFILTNRHVVEGAEKIEIHLRDGRRLRATLQGEDIQSDIAVLKVDADNLPAARLGDSTRLRVGQFAIAIGAPFELEYSVTFGHVSALGRAYLLPDGTMDQDFIQTDANINPGNSGGPLVNIEGEVIGINTLIRGLQTGIGFAVPISLAKEISDAIIKEGQYRRVWLGIGISAVRRSPDFQELERNVRDGVMVTTIREDGPAFRSALRAGDIITAVEGIPIRNEAELKAAVRGKEVAEPITLKVVRLDENLEGRELLIRVKPAAWPETLHQVAVVRPATRDDPVSHAGLKVDLLTRDLAEWFGVQKTRGVMIAAVKPASLADTKGLLSGDIITDVNHTPVATPGELREALRKGDLTQGITVNYIRRGNRQFVILKELGD